MLITSKIMLVHINYDTAGVNMAQQTTSPVNKRCLLVHNTMQQHIKTALKRHVWGVHATHLACLNILINFLREMHKQVNTKFDALTDTKLQQKNG
jgi:hypothetical protein